ncbi:ABC transporter permease [Aneurinibacillus danicus]|uniref:ABC transporter inner membrane protein n=1 Tax=Aneurinibacillus danicus TaxID=267746 RepID=A0A511V8U7_9BACL|nr:ABC transporter permease [Aneurinibacillus danicus]GEN35364.1 ABC transporter inner membrane protein [Aneurinibacillus danicus]
MRKFVKKQSRVNLEAVKFGLLSWFLVLIIWQIISLFSKPEFFPGPWQTLQGAIELIRDGTLQQYTLISYGRILTGWTLGSLIGIPIGLLMGKVRRVRLLLEPFVNFFRFIPALVFVTLFILWLGIGEQSKIALITYTTLFVVTLNTMAGVLAIDENKFRASRSMGATEGQIIWHVIIPATVPYIFNGIRLAMGNSFMAIVGAEMLAAKEGIGYLIWTSRLYLKTDWIFVGLITLGLMGFFMDKVLTNAGSLLLKKYGVKKADSTQRSMLQQAQ